MGGISTAGEAPEVTAAREVAEELGLKVSKSQLSDVLRCVAPWLRDGSGSCWLRFGSTHNRIFETFKKYTTPEYL